MKCAPYTTHTKQDWRVEFYRGGTIFGKWHHQVVWELHERGHPVDMEMGSLRSHFDSTYFF